MSAWMTFRLAVWRELNARWKLLVGFPAMLLVAMLLSEEVLRSLWFGVVSLLFPVLVGIVAARGAGESDAFWRGLGGEAWARLAGTATAHLPVIVASSWWYVTELTALRGDSIGTLGSMLPLHYGYLGGMLLLYGAIAAARSLGSGISALGGLVVGMLTLWMMVLAWTIRPEVSWTQAALSGGMVLMVGAVGLGVYWERRLGVWGASVSDGVLPRVLVPVLGLMTVAATSGWAWPEVAFGLYKPRLGVEPATALMIPFGKSANRDPYVWRWSGTGYERLPHDGVEDGRLGPSGAMALVTQANGEDSTILRLIVGEEEVACPVTMGVPASAQHKGLQFRGWRHDGRALAYEIAGGVWTIDLVQGCQPTGQETGGYWRGDALATIRGKEVRVGDEVVLMAQGKQPYLFQSGGQLFVVDRWRVVDGERGKRSIHDYIQVFRVETEQVVPLFDEAMPKSYVRASYGVVCVGVDCVLPDGTAWTRPGYTRIVNSELALVEVESSSRLFELYELETWTPTGHRFEMDWDTQFFVLPDGRLQLFDRYGVRELSREDGIVERGRLHSDWSLALMGNYGL